MGIKAIFLHVLVMFMMNSANLMGLCTEFFDSCPCEKTQEQKGEKHQDHEAKADFSCCYDCQCLCEHQLFDSMGSSILEPLLEMQKVRKSRRKNMLFPIDYLTNVFRPPIA